MQDEPRAGCLRKMKATPSRPESGVKEVISLLFEVTSLSAVELLDIKPGDVGLLSGGRLPGLLLVSGVILRFCHHAYCCCVAVRCHRHNNQKIQIFRLLKEVNRREGEVSRSWMGCSISMGCGEKGAWRRELVTAEV